jgi:hypothetical protein
MSCSLFHSLPTNLWVCILSNLDYFTLQDVLSSSQSFYDIFKTSSFLQKIYSRYDIVNYLDVQHSYSYQTISWLDKWRIPRFMINLSYLYELDASKMQLCNIFLEQEEQDELYLFEIPCKSIRSSLHNIYILDVKGNVYMGEIPFFEYVCNYLPQQIIVKRLKNDILDKNQIVQIEPSSTCIQFLTKEGVIYKYYCRTEQIICEFKLSYNAEIKQHYKKYYSDIVFMDGNEFCRKKHFPYNKIYSWNEEYKLALDIYGNLAIKKIDLYQKKQKKYKIKKKVKGCSFIKLTFIQRPVKQICTCLNHVFTLCESSYHDSRADSKISSNKSKIYILSEKFTDEDKIRLGGFIDEDGNVEFLHYKENVEGENKDENKHVKDKSDRNAILNRINCYEYSTNIFIKYLQVKQSIQISEDSISNTYYKLYAIDNENNIYTSNMSFEDIENEEFKTIIFKK